MSPLSFMTVLGSAVFVGEVKYRSCLVLSMGHSASVACFPCHGFNFLIPSAVAVSLFSYVIQ